MHTHGCSLPNQCLGQVIAYPQFIKGMARFVDYRKDRGINTLSIVRCNSDIVVVQICCKRMGADSQHTPAEIKSHIFCQKPGRFFLRLLGIISGQKAVIHFL